MGYFVFKEKSDKWRLVEETHVDGKSVKKTVSKGSYHVAGFNENMTLGEARERAKQLNLQANRARQSIRAAERIADQKEVESAYVPATLKSKFEATLTEETYSPNRLVTIQKHWSTVQKLIKDLELDPKQFYASKSKIYNWFIARQYSTSYIKQLTRMLNKWGYFMAQSTNSFFQPLPKPSSYVTQHIVEAREGKTGVRTEATPLTPEVLNDIRSSLEHAGLIEKWRWLYIAFYFGLRPEEVDQFNARPDRWKVSMDPTHKIEVLEVYQTKITGVEKKKRWKHIPVYLPEQKKALAMIREGKFDRPLTKTLRAYIGAGYGNYSPRNGFFDFMVAKDFLESDVSAFMGHTTMQRTYSSYKDKFKFKLPKAS